MTAIVEEIIQLGGTGSGYVCVLCFLLVFTFHSHRAAYPPPADEWTVESEGSAMQAGLSLVDLSQTVNLPQLVPSLVISAVEEDLGKFNTYILQLLDPLQSKTFGETMQTASTTASTIISVANTLLTETYLSPEETRRCKDILAAATRQATKLRLLLCPAGENVVACIEREPFPNTYDFLLRDPHTNVVNKHKRTKRTKYDSEEDGMSEEEDDPREQPDYTRNRTAITIPSVVNTGRGFVVRVMCGMNTTIEAEKIDVDVYLSAHSDDTIQEMAHAVSSGSIEDPPSSAHFPGGGITAIVDNTLRQSDGDCLLFIRLLCGSTKGQNVRLHVKLTVPVTTPDGRREVSLCVSSQSIFAVITNKSSQSGDIWPTQFSQELRPWVSRNFHKRTLSISWHLFANHLSYHFSEYIRRQRGNCGVIRRLDTSDLLAIRRQFFEDSTDSCMVLPARGLETFYRWWFPVMFCLAKVSPFSSAWHMGLVAGLHTFDKIPEKLNAEANPPGTFILRICTEPEASGCVSVAWIGQDHAHHASIFHPDSFADTAVNTKLGLKRKIFAYSLDDPTVFNHIARSRVLTHLLHSHGANSTDKETALSQFLKSRKELPERLKQLYNVLNPDLVL